MSARIAQDILATIGVIFATGGFFLGMIGSALFSEVSIGTGLFAFSIAWIFLIGAVINVGLGLQIVAEVTWQQD